MTNSKYEHILLLILDGWGLAPSWGGNAISLATTPNFDRLWREYPHTQLAAAGESVGLPKNEVGNSEVGHLNIGAGFIVHQDLLSINSEIESGRFFSNPAILEAINNAKEKKTKLHILGLASNGGVHSHLNHLYALLKLCKQEKFEDVHLHLFTDGRDSDTTEGIKTVKHVESEIEKYGLGQIESLSGRYYGMDRDHHWDRIKKVYDLLVSGIGPEALSAEEIVTSAYRNGVTDEFILPTKIVNNRKPFCPISEGDSVIFINYRRDRSDQLIRSLVLPKFDYFTRSKVIGNLKFTSFCFYEKDELPLSVAFHPKKVGKPLAQVISEHDLSQLHVAETEKFAHVTLFFNGGINKAFEGENRCLIPSPRVSTYDLKPEMSAYKITDLLVEEISKKHYNFIVANFANLDMVGHTGDFKATVKAAEAVDNCLGKIFEACQNHQTLMIITADHGNAEEMVGSVGTEIDTEHSINPVPFIITSSDFPKNLPEGKLANIAPTILKILGIEKPDEMTENSLV